MAFFDATNTTKARRAKLVERNRRERKEVSLIFVESLCDDLKVLERNYALKLQNKDYAGKQLIPNPFSTHPPTHPPTQPTFMVAYSNPLLILYPPIQP